MQKKFLLQILLLAQHVSDTTMPIIRSSKVLYSGCCSILQTGHITLSSAPDQQLENHSTKYHRQQPLYNTLELLMMGIVVPETCWNLKIQTFPVSKNNLKPVAYSKHVIIKTKYSVGEERTNR